MKIYESAENYLETILILKRKNNTVRSIDIVNELEYTKPSVSVAMKNLRENGYIEMDDDGYIHLTGKGLRIAEKMYERHRFCQTGSLHWGWKKRQLLRMPVEWSM